VITLEDIGIGKWIELAQDTARRKSLGQITRHYAHFSYRFLLFPSINSDSFPKYKYLNISDSRNSRNYSLWIQFIYLYEILIIVLDVELRRHVVIVEVKFYSVLTSVLDGYGARGSVVG
jgi:hypothetical protein